MLYIPFLVIFHIKCPVPEFFLFGLCQFVRVPAFSARGGREEDAWENGDQETAVQIGAGASQYHTALK